MGTWQEAIYRRAPIPLQNTLLTLHGWRLRRARFGETYRRLRREFERLERSTAAEQEAYQDDRLKILIRHCYENVPYYRQVMEDRKLRPEDVQSVRDLRKLPVLEKEDLRRNFDRLVSRTVDRSGLRLARTSGSTGAALACYWDDAVDCATNAVLWGHRSWVGFEFGAPYAALLGRMIVPETQNAPPFWRLNRAWNQLFLSSFHLDERTVDSYLAAMEAFGPQALDAYPSTAYVLARYLQARGRTFPLKSICTSTETLLPIQRELIEERFAGRVYDYLGEAERVLFAGECGTGEGMHLFTGYGITEVTDDAGAPRPVGETGHLVATGLHNLAMPLIRYRLGDVSALRPEPCRCGRRLPLLDRVTTKAEDIVVTPEGRYVSPSVLTHPFKPMGNIAASQIIQETADSLIVRIVRRPTYTDDDTRTLVSEFRKRVGETMKIEVVFVDSIPRGPGGKLRWVISKVPLRFGDRTNKNLFAEPGAEEKAG
jgi:phenylacetate-coenzyme A ligase PaaK-like adenylate-forming protein